MGSEKRKRNKITMVRLAEEEQEHLKQVASECSLSVPAYLRNLGLGYFPKSTLDNQILLEVLKLRGDMGKVGGLLKMWLSNEEKTELSQQLKISELINELNQLSEEAKALFIRLG